MNVDVLAPDSYQSYNIKLAQIFGLTTSVYWSVLLNIASKALKKKTMTDGYFKIDRRYIFEQTTLAVEDQIKIDSKLKQIGVLKLKEGTSDIISLDIMLMASVVANNDFEFLSDLSNKVRIKSNRESKESQRKKIIQNLKDGIVEPNYDILTALRNWVDAMFFGSKGTLSKSSIEIFQKTLQEYAKDDVQLKIRLIEIATNCQYRDCAWAIQVYERDNKMKDSMEQRLNSLPRTTAQRAATSMLDTGESF